MMITKKQYYTVKLPEDSYRDLDDAFNLCIEEVKNRRRTAGLIAGYTFWRVDDNTFRLRVTTVIR